jgi:hypothetical protein
LYSPAFLIHGEKGFDSSSSSIRKYFRSVHCFYLLLIIFIF